MTRTVVVKGSVHAIAPLDAALARQTFVCTCSLRFREAGLVSRRLHPSYVKTESQFDPKEVELPKLRYT